MTNDSPSEDNLDVQQEPAVFVVDDDRGMRDSLRILLEAAGFNIITFSSADEFLEQFTTPRPGCMVLDVMMPGMTGVELQEELHSRDIEIPIIFLTGHGDIPMAVRAMSRGAVSFITKPFDNRELLDAVKRALKQDAIERVRRAEREIVRERMSTLSDRERQILKLVLSGRLNKQVASELGISERTVEKHRARIMQKMEARSLPELVELTIRAEEDDEV